MHRLHSHAPNPRPLPYFLTPHRSGKSTLARTLGGVVLSTDDYFERGGRGYVFDATLLGEAHPWNLRRAAEACARREPLVVIDNTNTQAWEMYPYLALVSKQKQRRRRAHGGK